MIIFLAALLFSVPSFAQEVAITIDDSPMSSSLEFMGPERAKKIIKALKKHKAKAIFFSNSGKFVDKERLPRLKTYAKAGHYIGNHTHTHRHASKIGADEYIKDIEKADRVLSKIPNYKKWFRFPFLNQGKKKKTRDKIFSWLSSNNFQIGYVTIDSWDWYVNDLLQKAHQKGHKINYKELKRKYVNYIMDCSKEFHRRSLKVFKKPLRHTLLIHENDLNALFLDDILTEYKRLGWRIIDPVEAMNQEAFKKKLDSKRNGDGIVVAKESMSKPVETVWLNDYSHLNREFSFLIHPEKVLASGSNVGLFQKLTWGDYPHIDIKLKSGETKSFFAHGGQWSVFEDHAKKLSGTKIKIAWQKVERFVPEAGSVEKIVETTDICSFQPIKHTSKIGKKKLKLCK